MWLKANKSIVAMQAVAQEKSPLLAKIFLLFSGTAAGILTGLLGVGGGFLLVPTLLFAGKLSIRQAMSTSLLVICISCLISLYTHLTKGTVINIPVLWRFAFGSVIGLVVGTSIAKYISGEWLQKIFAIVVLLLAVYMLLQHI